MLPGLNLKASSNICSLHSSQVISLQLILDSTEQAIVLSTWKIGHMYTRL